MDDVAGEVALITGGGSGMGRALATSLAGDGARVAVLGRRADALAETVALCEGLGATALALPTDVRDPDAVQAAVDRTVAELGPPSIVVNAAAGNFYRSTRRTLEGAYVRPRHNGYMAFQDAASKRLNAGLINREAAAGILADLDRMFRESF